MIIRFGGFIEKEYEYKDNLHKIPTFVLRILLVLSFAFYNYYVTMASYRSVAYMMDVSAMPIFPYFDIYYLFVSAVISWIIWEFIVGVYYSFVRPSAPNLQLNKKGFKLYIMATYILRNVLGGALKLLIFAFGDVAFPLIENVVSIFITTACLFGCYLYIDKLYVPESDKRGFLKTFALPYLIYQGVSLILGGLL